MERNSRIDFLKGFLILTVMITNFGDLLGFPSRYIPYILYSFHMPLFLAISGYLLSNHTLSLPFRQFFKRYWHRIIFPTIIAWCMYYFVWFHNENYANFVDRIVYPIFHVWYVYNLLIASFILWICKKIHLSNEMIFLIAIGVTILSLVCRPMEIIGWLIMTYQPYYFCFFILGYYLRQEKIVISHNKIIFVGIILIGLWILRILLAETNNFQKVTWDFFILNFVSVLFFLSFPFHEIPRSTSKLNVLQWIGINSLPIYLWHPLIPLLIRSFHPLSEWLVGMLLYLVFIGCIYVGSKYDWINYHIFGSMNRKRKEKNEL